MLFTFRVNLYPAGIQGSQDDTTRIDEAAIV
jgi:hypothetical protein